MIRARVALTLGLCALTVLTAQTPPPPPAAAMPAAPAKPMRHLEYAFIASAQGAQTGATSDLLHGANVAGNGYRFDGGAGTMVVDVLSVAADGALVVRINEQLTNEPRPRQAFTCNVYGNTSVFCPAVPAPSAAEWVLLSFLGRQFVDGAPWSADGHWHRTETSAAFTAEEDFTLVDAGNGKKVVVQETRTVNLTNGGFGSTSSTITINYDRTMEVPDRIRDEVVSSDTNEPSNAHYEFTLLRDSFATKH